MKSARRVDLAFHCERRYRRLIAISEGAPHSSQEIGYIEHQIAIREAQISAFRRELARRHVMDEPQLQAEAAE